MLCVFLRLPGEAAFCWLESVADLCLESAPASVVLGGLEIKTGLGDVLVV